MLLLDDLDLKKEDFITNDGRFYFGMLTQLRKKGFYSLDEVTILSNMNDEVIERYEVCGGWESIQHQIDIINDKNFDTYIDILYREKAAFSDAVGHSMVDYLKEYANNKYSDSEYLELIKKYKKHQPFTKESLLYREIFEEFYPGLSDMIVDYWIPNKNWEGCNVNDPSARVLKNYGASGK